MLKPIFCRDFFQILDDIFIAPAEINDGNQQFLFQTQYLADDKRRSLHQRTGIFLILIPSFQPRRIAQGKTIKSVSFKECGMTVQQFDGEAAIGIGQLRSDVSTISLLVLAGKYYSALQGIQKTDQKRSIIIDQKRPRKTNPEDPSGCFPRYSRKSNFSRSSKNVSFRGLAQSAVIFIAAAAVESGLFTGHLHLGNGAVVIAALTGKSGKIAFRVDYVAETFKFGLPARSRTSLASRAAPIAPLTSRCSDTIKFFLRQLLIERPRPRLYYKIPPRSK